MSTPPHRWSTGGSRAWEQGQGQLAGLLPRLWCHTWILPVPVQPLISWVTLARLLDLLEPHFSHLQNKE